MPARIQVRRDGKTKRIIPVELKTSRLGGAAPSDMIVRGLRPHVLSLEFREDAYHVLNTGNQTLYLEESVIPPGSQMAWDTGEVLQIGRGLTLVLDIKGDPAPRQRSRTFLGIRPKDLLTESEVAARSHQQRLSVALSFIVLGILFFGYQIVFTKPKHDESVRRDLATVLEELESYQSLVQARHRRPNENAQIGDLADALKRARVAELENDLDTAKAVYASIRIHLRERYRNQGEFSDPIFQQVNRFVWERELANGLEIQGAQ